jgi:hypothetical protein
MNDTCPPHLERETWDFYRACMRALNEAGAPYLVGGAYAFERYTGIERHTKDFDIFCKKDDVETVLDVLMRLGCRTELTFPHWLGKGYHVPTGDFIDVIFSSGSGIAVVDDEWFAHAVPETVLGIPARLCPAEEIIWSKAFIMERERYDGNDVAHLLHASGQRLDWDRLLRRFDGYWRVLLAHLVLFGFIYPAERDHVPRRVLEELQARLAREAATTPPAELVCNGTLLSRQQYLVDVTEWGYRDARLAENVRMDAGDIAQWTKAIGDQNRRRADHAAAPVKEGDAA